MLIMHLKASTPYHALDLMVESLCEVARTGTYEQELILSMRR